MVDSSALKQPTCESQVRPDSVRAAPSIDRLVFAGVLAFSIWSLIRNFWLADDSFMFLRTAVQFADGNGLRFNINERVQSFTSPAWMILVALGYQISSNAFLVTFFLSAVCSGITLSLLYRASPSAARWSVLVSAGLLFSTRTFVDYQSSGLETPLLVMALTGFVTALLSRAPLSTLGSWGTLVVLTRFDAALFCIPGGLFALTQCWRTQRRWNVFRSELLGLLKAAVPLFAWCGFATLYYGSVVPSTAIAKLNHGIPWSTTVSQGLIYCIDLFVHDPAVPLIIILGVMVSLVRDLVSWPARAAVLGVVLHCAYVVMIGGDFMMGRFLLGEMVVSATVLGVVVAPALPLRACVGVVLMVVLLGRGGSCPPFSSCDVTPLRDVRENGVADERRFYWGQNSLQSWTLGAPLIQRGPAASTHEPSAVQLNSFPGAFGYRANQGVVLVDTYGLTDAFLARLRPETGDVFRAGHLQRHVPLGYLASVESGTPKMLDRDLNNFYQKYLVVTRAPLFSWERLAILPAFVLGRYDHYLRSYEARPLTLPLAMFPAVKDGSRWDSPGTVELPRRGILVTLEQPSESEVVGLQVDANDPVLVHFAECSRGVDGVTRVARELEGYNLPSAEGVGMQPRLIRRRWRVPFTCLVIRNVGPDPLSSVAGIALQ